MSSPNLEIAELKELVKKYQKQLETEQIKNEPQREKITQMSAEVIDSNPYSRLMALKRMGIVDNYEVFLYKYIKPTNIKTILMILITF